MANHLAVATASEALRQRLMSAISPEVPGVDVVTRRPDPADTAATSLVTVFLYRVTPHAALRNSDLPTRAADGTDVRRRPRVALTLHYLVSFSGDDGELVPQRMLGRTVATLHQTPTLTRPELSAAAQGADWLALSDVHTEVETIKLTVGDLSLDDLSKIWSVFFQVPYRLSVGYEASVVLIEADVKPREPLPVQRNGVHALPVPQPSIDRVHALGGGVVAGRPLTLEIVGRGLRGPVTRVRFDGGPPVPVDSASDTRIVATGDLPAGSHVVQVVHELALGDPPVPHSAVESAGAAFLVRPVVTAEYVPEDPEDPGVGAVVVGFWPALGRDQRVSLLLNQYVVPTPTDRVLRFERLEPETPPPEGATTVHFPRGTVPAGTYLVRAQVDGADSVLDLPRGGDNRLPEPRVVIP